MKHNDKVLFSQACFFWIKPNERRIERDTGYIYESFHADSAHYERCISLRVMSIGEYPDL